MTRVLLVTHYFPPEVGAPQARLSEMAAVWADNGADVTVLTGMPNHPTGVLPPEYRGAIIRTEERDGYRVLRTWLYATPNDGFLLKTLGHLSFMVTSVLLGAWRTGPVDVVVVSSPTFFSIGSAWLLARLRRARLVVEVRDLWPAIFVELGVLTKPSGDRSTGAVVTRGLPGGRHRGRGHRGLPSRPAASGRAGAQGAHHPQRRRPCSVRRGDGARS